jgi:hypothetical protein
MNTMYQRYSARVESFLNGVELFFINVGKLIRTLLIVAFWIVVAFVAFVLLLMAPPLGVPSAIIIGAIIVAMSNRSQ